MKLKPAIATLKPSEMRFEEKKSKKTKAKKVKGVKMMLN